MLYKNHKNIFYTFDPAATRSNIEKNSCNGIERWVMKLAAFQYTIVHVSAMELS